MHLLAELWRDERGVDAIEYALIAMFISIAAVASFLAIGEEVSDTLTTVEEAFQES